MPEVKRRVVEQHIAAAPKVVILAKDFLPNDVLDVGQPGAVERLARWLHEATSVACFAGKGTPWDGQLVESTKVKYRKLAGFMLSSETPPPGFTKEQPCRR